MSGANTAKAFDRNQQVRKVFQETSGVAKWVAGLEVLLGAIEQAAWDMRRLVVRTGHAVKNRWLNAGGILNESVDEGKDLFVQLGRLLDTGRTISAVVLSYRTTAIRGAFMSADGYQRLMRRVHRRNAERFVELCERQQGGLIKIGQLLAVRVDILPADVTAVLSTLQDSVKPLTNEEVEIALERAWGAERRANVDVDPDPVGAASISQVHRATLPDGRIVAVKVQRPGIDRILAHDMANMRRVLNALQAYMPEMDLDPIIDEVEAQVMSEVDFEAEMTAGERAAELVATIPGVKVPAVDRDWSTGTVMVSEFIEGRRLDEALEDRVQAGRTEANTRVLANIVSLYMRQILLWGFFQPDAHFGNFLVTDDDELVLLDFGCVRELDQEFRQTLAGLLQAFLGGDDATAASALGKLGFTTRSGDLTAVVAAGRTMLAGLAGSGSDVWDVDQLMAEFGDLAGDLLDDPVTRMPPEMVMLGRVLGALGGLFMVHKPDLNPMETMVPVVMEAFSVN